jgi:hypothetical protein
VHTLARLQVQLLSEEKGSAIEYYYDVKLDGHPSHVEGIKKIKLT